MLNATLRSRKRTTKSVCDASLAILTQTHSHSARTRKALRRRHPRRRLSAPTKTKKRRTRLTRYTARPRWRPSYTTPTRTSRAKRASASASQAATPHCSLICRPACRRTHTRRRQQASAAALRWEMRDRRVRVRFAACRNTKRKTLSGYRLARRMPSVGAATSKTWRWVASAFLHATEASVAVLKKSLAICSVAQSVMHAAVNVAKMLTRRCKSALGCRQLPHGHRNMQLAPHLTTRRLRHASLRRRCARINAVHATLREDADPKSFFLFTS